MLSSSFFAVKNIDHHSHPNEHSLSYSFSLSKVQLHISECLLDVKKIAYFLYTLVKMNKERNNIQIEKSNSDWDSWSLVNNNVKYA